MAKRTVIQILTGRPTSDGGGVRLVRVITPESKLDPFLMLDEFDSDEPNDYIAGFPSHPHRGFETVTYMLDGHLLHEDHLGNRGDLVAGGVQWMTAGRGIIHSEMPQQIAGRMRGFQLWLNLPARDKMKPAGYRDLDPEEIPHVRLGDSEVTVVAGTFHSDGMEPVSGPVVGGATDPLYLDLAISPGATIPVGIPSGHTALVYVFEGGVDINGQRVAKGSLGHLSDGDSVDITAGSESGRVLLLAARPLREPVVSYGPFVMNTVAEIEQALRDFRSGQLTE
jgi:redox-sensitive bicupin YhaK (pirin superfamily)